MNNYDKAELAYKLAKEKYGDSALAFSALWGSASVLLTETNLDTVIRVMEK